MKCAFVPTADVQGDRCINSLGSFNHSTEATTVMMWLQNRIDWQDMREKTKFIVALPPFSPANNALCRVTEIVLNPGRLPACLLTAAKRYCLSVCRDSCIHYVRIRRRGDATHCHSQFTKPTMPPPPRVSCILFYRFEEEIVLDTTTTTTTYAHQSMEGYQYW